MPSRSVEIKVDIVSDPHGSTKVKHVVSDIEKDVIASQKRIEANRKATDRAIIASVKAGADAEKREARAKANTLIQELKRIESEAKRSSTSIQGYLKSAFGGGLIGGAIGGVAGSIIGQFTSAFAQLPALFKTQLDEMVRIAADRQNAFKGLESMSRFLGLDPKDTQDTVRNLRLVKAGVVDIGDATISLKNLLSSGFNLKEANQLLEAFSDTAAFGKSAALSFGEAIRGATEGIRNGNSILVDNVGLTKNLSQILKEAGFAEKDLMNVKDDINVRQALFNGLLKEALPQMGDANKLTQGWTGNTAALTTAQNNLYAAIGNVIIKNAELNALVKTLTGDLNDLTQQVQNTESGWNKSINSMTSAFVQFTLDVRVGVQKEIADLKELVRMAEIAANAIAYAFWVSANPGGAAADYLGGKLGFQSTNPFAPAINETFGNMSRAYGQMGTDYRAAQTAELRFRSQYGTNLRNQWQGVQPLSSRQSSFFINPLGPSNATWTGIMGQPNVLPAGGSRIDTDKIKKYQTQIADLEKLKAEASGRELKNIQAQIEKRKKIVENLEKGVGIEAAKAALIGGGRGRVRAAVNTDERKYKAIVEFARDMGFDIPDPVKSTTGGRHMEGSLHYAGRAVDVRTRNKTAQEIGEFIAEALQRGFRVYDERSKPGQPHLHLEANNRRESIFDPRQSYGNIPIGLLRQLDAKRFERLSGGVGPDDIARYYKDFIPREQITLMGRTFPGREITTGEGAFSSDLLIGRDKEIEQNQKLADAYMEAADALYNLNEHSREENFLRDYKLGKYGDLNEQQAREIANTHRLIDLEEKRRKNQEAVNEVLEKTREEQQRVFDDFRQGWEDIITDLTEGRWKSVWDQMRRNFLQNFIGPVSQYLAQLSMPNGAMGGQQQGGGFNLGSLLNIFNPQSGPGGTPFFNPSATGGFGNFGGQINVGSWGASSGGGGGGGMWGGWNDLKNMQSGLNLGGAQGGGGLSGMLRSMGGGSKMAGLGSGLGAIAMMAGQAIGGKWGNTLQLTGMGAQIGAQVGGPWGAVIGASIGFGAGLLQFLFKDNSIKKLKEAALSTYGITVKDKTVLNALKQLGETMFGKNRVGQNAVAVVSSDQGQTILRNYAEATNQKTTMMDRMYYSDENWEGNQFRSQFGGFGKFGGFRAYGGPVRAGMSYVVGEHRPELFTPTQNGVISPTVGVGDQKFMVIIGQLEETVHMLAARLEGISAGSVLRMGAAEDPDVIGDVAGQQVRTRPELTEDIAKGTGRVYY